MVRKKGIYQLPGSHNSKEHTFKSNNIMSLSFYFSELLAEKGFDSTQVNIVVDRHTANHHERRSSGQQQCELLEEEEVMQRKGSITQQQPVPNCLSDVFIRSELFSSEHDGGVLVDVDVDNDNLLSQSPSSTSGAAESKERSGCEALTQ